MKKIKVKFKEWNCIARIGLYENFRLAIMLEDETDGDLVATATVNLPEAELDEDSIFVKDYSENEGMVKALQEAGIITKDITGSYPTRFALITAYHLSRIGIEMLGTAMDADINQENINKK